MPRVTMTELRQYRMQLALHVLDGAGRMSTAEVSEAIEDVARGADHPAEDWQMTPAELVGVLRSMTEAGQISAEVNYDSKLGRNVPSWWSKHEDVPMPARPGVVASTTSTARAIDALTRQPAPPADDRLQGIMERMSRVSTALARAQAEVDALNREVFKLMKDQA